jgi:RHS repeat-associated protein
VLHGLAVLPYEGKEKKVELFGSGAQSTERLQSTETAWTELAERRGVVPSETKTTLYGSDNDQAVTATTKSTRSYDSFGNLIELREYAYASGEPSEVLRTTVREYETAAGSPYIDLEHGVYLSGLLKKETITGGGVQSETSYHHDDYSVFGLIPRGTVSGHNAAFDPSKIRRGNATRIVQRRDSSSTVEWKQQFDVLGNLVKQVNPLNHATDFAFDDCFLGSGTAAQPATPTFAFATQVTNALGHSAHYCFDYQLGAIRTFADPNAVVTQYQYGGALDRLVSVAEAEGTSVERRHRFVYDDVNRTIVSESNKDSVSAYPIRTTIRYDRLGRTTQTEQDDEQGTIYVTKEYDGLGRVSRTTHPYRDGDPQRWTSTQYDGLGRVVAVAAPDGATQTTTFIANRSRQMDPALKWREFTLDALGRMESVKEGDGAITNYGYDALGGLRTVAQSGQTRAFVYNDLGWLLSADNPESRLISYGHDGLGNVTSRSMGGHITTYSFDAINRPLQVVYADFPAQNVTYAYHSQAPRIGRLASVSNAVSSTVYPVYDERGRILESHQTFTGIAANGEPVKFEFQYSYDLAGHVTSTELPSGRTIHTAWSSGGRALHVSGVRGQTMTNYFASAAAPALYAAHGALREAQWGNGLWERWEYLPERLQPWRVRMGSQTQASSRGEWQFAYCEGSWGLSCASNNGNLVGQQIQPANVTQAYSFDALNRISTASESGGGWSETYGFDVHGNLWWNSRSASLGGPHLMRPDGADWFENGNNRAVKPGELEEGSFDAAGNLTKAGVLRLEYDGENRLAKAVGSGSTVYEYDGLGQRVTKQEAGGTLTYYVYDAFGGLAAEYLPTGPDSTVGTHYLSTDHLGSTRLVTNASGDVVSRHDYLPFGEEIPNTVGNRQSVTGYAWNGSLTQRFTGKERDGETGLDYFGARYYSGAQGRFSSPDLPFMDQRPEDPQSWNLYGYVRNNPLVHVDPTGMKAISAEECKNNPDCVSVPINVIYDQNAQIFDGDGNVLSAVQSKVDDQIAAAQDAYGNALVSFDISYSTGAIQNSGQSQTVSGTQPGINVVVTDSRDSFVPGGAMEAGGRALIRLNAGTSDRSTLSHELGHVLAGDTRVPRIPVLGQIMNAMLDIRTDTARTLLPFYSPYHGNRFDPPPGKSLRVTNLFNQGAQRFRRR